mgnify:CR=1 FL=1
MVYLHVYIIPVYKYTCIHYTCTYSDCSLSLQILFVSKAGFQKINFRIKIRYLCFCIGSGKGDGTPSVTVTSPGSPGMTRRLMSITHVTGKIQVWCCETSRFTCSL